VRSIAARLGDIREAIGDIDDLVASVDRGADGTPAMDRRTYRALRDALTQIGETIKALPADLRERHPDVDWRGLAGLRDLLVHAYFRIDAPMLWRTVVGDDLRRLSLAIDAELGT
jgi:uncharacterized protein with HEPN domain